MSDTATATELPKKFRRATRTPCERCGGVLTAKTISVTNPAGAQEKRSLIQCRSCDFSQMRVPWDRAG